MFEKQFFSKIPFGFIRFYTLFFVFTRVSKTNIMRNIILAFSDTAVTISIILKRTFLTYVWKGDQNEKKSNEQTQRFTLPFLRKTLQSADREQLPSPLGRRNSLRRDRAEHYALP